MKTAVMTDTNSGITKQEADALGIFLMQMPVIIDGETHYEGLDLTHDSFFAALTGNQNVSTSQPSPGDVMDMWDEILNSGYDEIIYIPMSSGLSASCEAAMGLALDYDGKVQVANNHRISVTMRISVMEAKHYADLGASAAKIKELNGDKTVSACFVVGGGGKIHGFTEKLAGHLDLPTERVALRGEEVLKEVTFEQEDIKKDPLLVTPIGICLNYYEQKNNFIMVRFNGERLKLYDNNRLTIVDAAMQAGFPNDQLFPKRGMPINFTVNGGARIARGEAGEAAIVTMNGQPANINTPLEPNSDITIEPSTAGDNAVYTIGQLPEYHESVISFVINGQNVVCPKFVEVNGSLEPDSYEIQEGDSIETRNFYTVAQIAEFMDVEIDPDSEILVNNREAGMETLVYENFSIDWTPLSFGVASESENRYNATEGVTDSAEISREEMTPETSGETKAAESEKKDTVCVVTVNGETVELTGKEDYIFVDVFDRITFDLNAGNGRAIATLVNGMEAEFSQPLNNGDRVEIYWKEK